MITKITDIGEIAPILKKYFKGYIFNNDPFEKVLVYSKDDILAIISYSIIYERAEINYIITMPEKRKQGIGNELLNKALSDIENHGCKSVSLEVEIENKAAINLYLKNGFHKKGIRKNYYDSKDAYLMVKEIEVRK